MITLVEVLVLAGCLLAIVALIQVVAARTAIPEASLLCLAGITLGGSYVAIATVAPEFAQFFFQPLLEPGLPAEAYLWLFLPPLLFQAALSVDVRNMMQDVAPILLLAIVAVFVSTGVIGFALSPFLPHSLVACLLLGAIVATTDPSAVIGIFRNVGAPARLIRLVEGESLLNDAAAIAIAGVLIGMLSGHASEASWSHGLQALAYGFLGGALLGVMAGRALAFVLHRMNGVAAAETTLTMAVPYPLYLLGSEVLDVSGVVAVVCAALVINGLGRTRLSRRSWQHLQLVWEQIAVLAGAIVFLLAAVRIPYLLDGLDWVDAGLVGVTVVAALLARLAVLFLLFPSLSRFGLSAPISRPYKLAIAWGGLRGAITLVLALGIVENRAIPADTRHFISITATGFVLFSLLVNGGTLRRVIRALRLDRLSPQDQALQQQALSLANEEVEAALRKTAAVFRIDEEQARLISQELARDIAASVPDITPLSDGQRLAIGLTTLATREADLIPEYGNGVISITNLDAMMRNTGHMIDAARLEGVAGYQREAARILAPTRRYRLGLWLHERLRISYPLALALVDRFELMICRRAVLERLRHYNRLRLTPILGPAQVEQLDSILEARMQAVDQAIQQVRSRFGDFTAGLEKRLLRLFALRQSRSTLEVMVNERMISREVHDRINRSIDATWESYLERPALPRRQPSSRPE